MYYKQHTIRDESLFTGKILHASLAIICLSKDCTGITKSNGSTDIGNMCCTPLYVTLLSFDYCADFTGIFRIMQQKHSF
jgi:hypothetical protein